jgi:hypothetical protein
MFAKAKAIINSLRFSRRSSDLQNLPIDEKPSFDVKPIEESFIQNPQRIESNEEDVTIV